METSNVPDTNNQEQSADAPAETLNAKAGAVPLKICNTPIGKFSSPISVDDGNIQIKRYTAVQPILKIISMQLPPNSDEKMFLENIADNNVFIFDKNMIERFQKLTFDYYAVCLGFNANGATVIFGAFKEINTHELQSIKPVGDDDCSLSEHPQRKSIVGITRNLQGQSPLTIVLK